MPSTYILRFDSVSARDRFVDAVRRRGGGLGRLELIKGEFLPDVIVRGVSADTLAQLREIAPRARIMPDFRHSPM